MPPGGLGTRALHRVLHGAIALTRMGIDTYDAVESGVGMARGYWEMKAERVS